MNLNQHVPLARPGALDRALQRAINPPLLEPRACCRPVPLDPLRLIVWGGYAVAVGLVVWGFVR